MEVERIPWEVDRRYLKCTPLDDDGNPLGQVYFEKRADEELAKELEDQRAAAREPVTINGSKPTWVRGRLGRTAVIVGVVALVIALAWRVAIALADL